MKTKSLLLAFIFMAVLISSCDSSIESDMLPLGDIALDDVSTRGISIDILENGTVMPLEETEELRILKEYAERRKNNQRSLMAYGDYDENFSSNIWAIRELPISLYARGQGNTNNRYLSCEGKNQEVKLVASVTSNKQKFHLKVLPTTSGIPYLIYSVQAQTPLVVGYYNNAVNDKIIFSKPDDTGSLFSAGWDLITSQTNKGYFAIQSQSYLGQSDPDNWWSVFNYVVEVKDDNKVGYGQYSKKAQQEFLLKPEVQFQLREVIFDANSAVISGAPDIKFVSTARNTSVETKPYTIPVYRAYYETSNFMEKQSDITFNIGNLSKTFQRPTVQANRIVLPESVTPHDAQYRTLSLQNIWKFLQFNIEGDAPENSLIEVTSYIKTYNVSINYTVKAYYLEREVKFSGTWRGYVISDPALAKPNHVPRYFDLDTGEEIYYFSRSAIKTALKQ